MGSKPRRRQGAGPSHPPQQVWAAQQAMAGEANITAWPIRRQLRSNLPGRILCSRTRRANPSGTLNRYCVEGPEARPLAAPAPGRLSSTAGPTPSPGAVIRCACIVVQVCAAQRPRRRCSATTFQVWLILQRRGAPIVTVGALEVQQAVDTRRRTGGSRCWKLLQPVLQPQRPAGPELGP